jgi:peptidoglycan/xylan/chitin deacetylase (PgdA/CDA1 family)
MEKKALQFHRIAPDFQFCGTWNTPVQLERFLHFLKKNDIPVVLPGQSGSGIILTFDDGENSLYEHAFPILKKYGMKAIVFLIVDYIGKENTWDLNIAGRRIMHLTWDQIYEMREGGIEFGSHTLTHRNLAHLPYETVRRELLLSKQILEKRLGECRCLSYPFNRVNERIVQIARDSGYEYGFGGDGADRLRIKKEAVYITDTVQSLRTKIYERPSGLYWYERIKQRIINYFTIATMISKGANIRS